MPSEETLELHKEWRAIVLSKLNNLESGQQAAVKEIGDLKTTVAQTNSMNDEIKTLTLKVEKLEAFRSRLIGMFFAANTIAGILGWLISTFLIKH